jgi:glycosyltransferase 2 family protein
MRIYLKYKRGISIFFRLCLISSILFYLISKDRLNLDKISLLWNNPIILCWMIFLIVGIIILTAAFRWWLLLLAAEIKISFRQVFSLTWIGIFFNSTLPGSISGDVVKGVYVVKAVGANIKTKTFMTMFIDRFTGLFGLIVMSFSALIINWEFIQTRPELKSVALIIEILFIITLLFYILVAYQFPADKDPFIRLIRVLPKNRYFLRLYTSFKNYQNHKRILFGTLILSVLAHSCIAYIFYIIANLLGSNSVGMTTQMLIMPIGIISIAIPLAPGGIGVGHAVFESLYGFVGIQGGADIFNLYIVLQLTINMFGGIVYLFYNGKYLPYTNPPIIRSKN